MNCILDLN